MSRKHDGEAGHAPGFFTLKCTTLPSPGGIATPGTMPGDLMLGAYYGQYWLAPGAGLEATVTVADEIQQTNSNGPFEVTILMLRPANGN